MARWTSHGVSAGVSTVLAFLAHHDLGHHTPAITCYQHAIDLGRDLGDPYYMAATLIHLGDPYCMAATLIHLGDTHHAAGNPHAARDSWQQAQTILDDLNHPDADEVRSKLDTLYPL